MRIALFFLLPALLLAANLHVSASPNAACAVALPDGRSFLTGGRATTNSLPLAAYFEKDGTVSPASPMVEARAGHVCVGFPDGSVLVAGGDTGKRGATNSAEVFDVGSVFVQTVDAVLAAWVCGQSSLCEFHPECGDGVALEHNGDLYSCDHFVEQAYLLGNILRTPLTELVSSEKQCRFGDDKGAGLPRYCRECRFLFECYGECPKNRFLVTPDGESGLNYLCAGLRAYFEHVNPYMRTMAGLLSQRRPTSEIMDILRVEEAQLAQQFAHAGRNDPCPCGSGRKYKKCHEPLPLASYRVMANAWHVMAAS